MISRLQSFETEVLTQEENLAGLAALNRELIARAEATLSVRQSPAPNPPLTSAPPPHLILSAEKLPDPIALPSLRSLPCYRGGTFT